MSSSCTINVDELSIDFASRSLEDHEVSTEDSNGSECEASDSPDDRSTRLLVAQESGIVKW